MSKLLVSVLQLYLVLTGVQVFAETIVKWDFTKGTHGWTPNGRVEPLKSTSEGLVVKATGPDPWIEGPAVDYPAVELVRVTVRMKSTADSGAEFFYGRSFKPGDEVRFNVRNDGQWHDYPVLIRATLGPKTRLRLDPCHNAGELVVASIKVEAIEKIEPPALEKPSLPTRGTAPKAVVKSGDLTFEHYGERWGNFSVKVDGTEMAIGYDSELIGFMNGNEVEWLNLKNSKVTIRMKRDHRSCWIEAKLRDSRGARWLLRRIFDAGEIWEQEHSIKVSMNAHVNKDTDVVYLPGLTLFSGVGTFGERKNQAVFAGLEYLCDEPSSSDADIAKPHHIRRTPDPLKVTFPLMAIEQDGRYIGLVWWRPSRMAPTFDSPDRLYNSGGHVMSISAPAVGNLKFENDFAGHSPFRFPAFGRYIHSATIIGGKGKTIIPAIKQYVDIRGLPELPQYKGGLEAAVNVLGHGWLDSKINEDGRFRHAVWGDNFKAQPAADAAVYMDWLANHCKDTDLQKRLRAERDKALSRLNANDPFSSGISHIRPPSGPLVFGRVDEFIGIRKRQAIEQIKRFDDKGILPYRAGKQDYARTHFAGHANGYAAKTVTSILEAATLSGDKALAKQAVELLDKQTALYAQTVPRGAQTWEIPLHTPDILASAYMTKACVLGYLLTDRQDLLQQAQYWAWTGVPFVYLAPPNPPTDGEIGPYATIAVLGATNWRRPVWFGKPVQWCGLVYCSALHNLADHDPEGPWKRIAKGITAAGLQMTWSTTDKERQGLLPDFFSLVEQFSDGPAINPGTVGAHVPELYGAGTMYDLKKLPKRQWFIHAPCTISDIKEDARQASLAVDGWGERPFYVLISGITNKPAQISVRPRGIANAPYEVADAQYHDRHTYVVIKLKGAWQIRLR